MNKNPDRKLFISKEKSWVGEYWVNVRKAPFELFLPDIYDTRWVAGSPTFFDVEVLILTPFYPSNRLDVSTDIRRNNGPRYPNHPAFQGCVAWMHIPTFEELSKC